MPDFAPPPYPEILTAKNWNKNKGLWAKLVGSTGIGQLMTETERYFDGVKWETFDFKKQLRMETAQPTIDDLDRLYKIAEGQLTQTKRVEGSAGRLKRLAVQVVKDFKANKQIPKGSTAHAEKVRDAAETFESGMGDIKKLLDVQYAAGKQYVERERAELARALKDMYRALDACQSKAKSVKTRDDLKAFFGKELEVVRKEYGNIARIVDFTRGDQRGWLVKCSPKAIPSDDSSVKDCLTGVLGVLQGFRDRMDEFGKK